MKGWIKVRELSCEHERYIRTSDIEQIAVPDEGQGSYLFTLRGSLVHVRETLEEVFALIEEAENGKEKSLLTLLKSVKAECDKNEECETCKWDNIDPCPWKMSLNSHPIGWDLEKIPEEYR